MMTGPFEPAAASWMCAMVPAMPVVVTLPLTDPSAPTMMLPLPLAEVVTGGTSWSPARDNWPCPAAKPAYASATPAAMAAKPLVMGDLKDPAFIDCLALVDDVFVNTPGSSADIPLRFPALAGPRTAPATPEP